MRTRFAPSPTGTLHLGHAFSALTAWQLAREAGGEFLLRIENIDRDRCRLDYEELIYKDLAWLGLEWAEPVMRQSDRIPVYRAALRRLHEMGLLYPCTCSRRDVAAALAAPQEGDRRSLVYPGTCRGRRDFPEGAAWRLDVARAMRRVGTLEFLEEGELAGQHRVHADELVRGLGDVVLGRKDLGVSYHLAVVLDDAEQGVTHVVRGTDLFGVTPLHRLLQELLDLPVPVWHHHRLIRDETGRRLAKRDDARAIAEYREQGRTPADVRRMAGVG